MTTGRFEYTDEDLEFLDRYKEGVDHLAKLVIEMVRDNPSTLLSPALRDALCRQALLVSMAHSQIHYKLVVDNPSKPLDWEATQNAARNRI